jgi:predicted 3-demethylubiquinone-9 3-methyltransferase (glyoxalase superfamily)
MRRLISHEEWRALQKITPHLWFDQEAIEAADFYVSTFPNSNIKSTTRLRNTPSGSVDIVTFELSGLEFQAISAGPFFKFNPSVSFHVNCETEEEVNRLCEKLSAGGQVLMELSEYPFSERYSWVQDKYGLSWQIIYSKDAVMKQKITPALMFVGDVCGRAEEAINFWISVFHTGKGNAVQHYGKGEEPDKQGSVKFASFSLFGQDFGAMDSAYDHRFMSNEAISFIVNCDTQNEIDDYWEKLSADPEAEQCGWLKDKFGLSWQIVPTAMDEMMNKGSKEQITRVTEAFLKMKKFDLAELQKAYEGI